jgi:hypothetical protein
VTIGAVVGAAAAVLIVWMALGRTAGVLTAIFLACAIVYEMRRRR